jgi:AraC-like DNA-binding protein
LPFYRDELARVLNVDITPLGNGPPRHGLDYVDAGPIGISRQQGSPCLCHRTQRHLRDCDENFTLGLVTRGRVRMSQNGRAVQAEAGEGFFLANALPLESMMPDDLTVTVLRIDGPSLRALVSTPERAAGDHIAATRPGVALLRGYLQAYNAAADGLTPDLLASFGRHVLDLVAAVLGTTRDGAVAAETGGIRAARIRSVLAAIAEHAGDPKFGVETMAAELSVTTRHIQRVLEETGKTFSEHLIEQRLRRAWQLLTDPQSSRAKIAAIAFESGFSDLSTFNRTFRRRFGETPTAVRELALGEGVPGAEGTASPLVTSLARH